MKKETEPQTSHHGETIGRKMIVDLVASFQRAQSGDVADGLSVLSDEEKTALVNGLIEPEDIRRYNEFRYIHEYLVNAPTTFAFHEQIADSSSFRLLSILTNLSAAEDENAIQRHVPRIMTQKQFDELTQSDSLNAPYGVAIIQDQSCVENIDENGHYQPPATFWRRHYLAEKFLQSSISTVHSLLEKYNAAIQKCFAIATALQLIGEFIGVSSVSMLVSKVDTTRVDIMNNLMEDIPNHVYRYGLYPDERPQDMLRDQLRSVLRPVDVEALMPTKLAITKARKFLNFATFQGNINQFYAILLNGGNKA